MSSSEKIRGDRIQRRGKIHIKMNKEHGEGMMQIRGCCQNALTVKISNLSLKLNITLLSQNKDELMKRLES